MTSQTYLDLIAFLGIGSAHPGGMGLTKDILNNENIHEATHILDVGCGTGMTAAYLKETYKCPVSAIDNHPEMIKKAKKRFERLQLNIQIETGDAEQLAFSDDTFDLVLSESVTSFTKIDVTLKEYLRVLKPGGTLINLDMTAEQVLDPNIEKQIIDLYGVKAILTESEWIKRLNGVGFTTVNITYGRSAEEELLLQAAGDQNDSLMELDLSPSFNSELYDIWAKHEDMLEKYGHLLGHRVYRAVK